MALNTGNLYYSHIQQPYVKPPTESRRRLALAKEEDYLRARKGRNFLEETVNNLPFLEKDRELYEDLKEKTGSFINSIDAVDNLEDTVLDVDQFSHDFVNKFGAQQLKNSYDKMQTELGILDEAYNNDEIRDPGMVNWYKKKLMDSYIPIKKDIESGNILSGKVAKADYVPFVDVPKELDEMLKGFKENGVFSEVRDAQGRPTGMVKVGTQIPGFLNYTTGTEIPVEELYSSALSYLRSRPDAEAYLRERAKYKTEAIPPTVENLQRILTPKLSYQLFGTEDPSMRELQELIDSGELDVKNTIEDILYTRELMDSVELPVNKYGFTKVKPEFIEDKLMLENIKSSAKLNRGKAGEASIGTNADVSVHKFTTVQKMSPADVKVLKENRQELSEHRKDLQAQINRYNKALLNNDPTVHPDQLRRYEEEMRSLDENLENIERQEENINFTSFDKIKDVGFDTDSVYRNLLPESMSQNRERNAKRALSIGIDITDYAKVEEDGSVTIDGKEVPKGSIDTYTIDGKDRYVVNYTTGTPGVNKGEIEDYNMVLDKILDTNGNVTNSYKGVSPTSFSAFGKPEEFVFTNAESDMFSRLANKEELEYIMSDLYQKKSDTGFFESGLDTTPGRYNNEKGVTFAIDKLMPYIDNTISKKGKLEDIDVTRDMSYIIVEGETTKDALKAYNSYRDTLRETFKTSPDAYKVGDISLGQYLSENYDIDNLLEDIDWSKTDIRPLLERDRTNGQLYGITLIPTEKGLKKIGSKDVFGSTNSIKIVSSYAGSDQKIQDNHIQNILLKSFSGIQENLDIEYNIDMLKEAGRMYINADPAGKALDDLNLYVLHAGGEATWNVEGQDILIKALERDVRTRDLMDVDFVTETIVGGKRKVMVYNNQGEPGWVDKDEFDRDVAETKNNRTRARTYRQVIFESPADLKKVFGATLLNKRYRDIKNSNQMPTSYIDYYKSGYNLKTDNEIKINNYRNYRTNLSNLYNNNTLVSLTNNKGAKVFFESRVPQNDLIDLRTELSKHMWSNNRLPYINKYAYPYAKDLIQNYNLLVTGGFRGENTHDGLAGSVEDSAHKYAYGLDIDDNEAGLKLFKELKDNPNLLAKYNITRLLRHNNHIHIEFGETSV